MNTYEINLDVSKSTVTNSPVVLGQGDKSATTIVARIFDHGSPISTSGLTAKLKMRLPDGRHFYEKSATWDATNSKATVTIDETQAASAVGETRECYFELLQGSAVICSTSRFSVRVLRSATQGTDGAESYSDEIEQLVDDLNAAKTAAQNATSGANSAATAANDAATAANSAASDIRTAAARGDFDGTSPSASVSRQTGGALVTVTDRSGPTTAMVYDGAKGDKGDKGDTGDAYEITSADYDEIAARVEVPLMSPDTRGGAKLGKGLRVESGALVSGSYYTTETVDGHRQLVQVYELVEE